MKPDEHYIPVHRDLSNAEEVKSKISNNLLCEKILQNFKNDIIDSSKYRYSYFVNNIVFKDIEIFPITTNTGINRIIARLISESLFWTHIILKKIFR